jgi:hypothetical protein
MREIGRIRLIKLIRLIAGLMVAGEMNFAPTNIAHAFEDEAVGGAARKLNAAAEGSRQPRNVACW